MDYKIVIFNGHGSPSCIMGHKNEKIIFVGENDFLLKDRITYARSCWAVVELGKKCAEGGNGCFVGYRIPFMFIIDITRITNPLKDNIAKVFFETSNLVPLGLIKGHTAEESNENAKRSMLKSINKASETSCVLPHTKVCGLFGVSETEISGQLQSNCPLPKGSGLIEISVLKRGDKDSQAIAQTLWNNYVGQEVIGNKKAKLF